MFKTSIYTVTAAVNSGKYTVTDEVVSESEEGAMREFYEMHRNLNCTITSVVLKQPLRRYMVLYTLKVNRREKTGHMYVTAANKKNACWKCGEYLRHKTGRKARCLDAELVCA